MEGKHISLYKKVHQSSWKSRNFTIVWPCKGNMWLYLDEKALKWVKKLWNHKKYKKDFWLLDFFALLEKNYHGSDQVPIFLITIDVKKNI